MDSIASLSLEDVEEETIWLAVGASDNVISYAQHLVGMFLTSVVYFQTMRSTPENVWHPINGVSISNIENGRFLFRFYLEVDVDRVVKNGLWNFNSHLFILHRLKEEENILSI